MKRIYRVLKNEDFREILNKRQCVSRENFKVFYKKSKIGHLRIGISVSSKVGNSVIRHKIKRQVDAMIYNLVDVKNPLDIVIIVKKDFLNNSYSKNYDALANVIKYILKKESLNEE